jgi:anti-anti-sigma factor
MADGAYLTLYPHASCLIAHVTSEKVGARESQIIEQELRAAAGSSAGKKWRIVLDMKDVTMLASMGLGMLVSMHKLCAAEGGKLVVCGLKDDILQLMKITHLERILKIAPDRETAIKMVG